jgi:hypothetical protein
VNGFGARPNLSASSQNLSALLHSLSATPFSLSAVCHNLSASLGMWARGESPYSVPSRLNCRIINIVSAARLPWERRRPAGILKTVGRRPGHLAGTATIAGVPPIPPDMPAGRQRSQGKRDLPILTTCRSRRQYSPYCLGESSSTLMCIREVVRRFRDPVEARGRLKWRERSVLGCWTSTSSTAAYPRARTPEGSG